MSRPTLTIDICTALLLGSMWLEDKVIQYLETAEFLHVINIFLENFERVVKSGDDTKK